MLNVYEWFYIADKNQSTAYKEATFPWVLDDYIMKFLA